jgi:hypothetical protein
MKIRPQRAPGALGADANAREPAADPRVDSARGDPAVTEFARDLTHLGSVGGNVNRNRIVEVDEAAVAMEKLYVARAAAKGVVDRFAVQKRTQHP